MKHRLARRLFARLPWGLQQTIRRCILRDPYWECDVGSDGITRRWIEWDDLFTIPVEGIVYITSLSSQPSGKKGKA